MEPDIFRDTSSCFCTTFQSAINSTSSYLQKLYRKRNKNVFYKATIVSVCSRNRSGFNPTLVCRGPRFEGQLIITGYDKGVGTTDICPLN